MKLYIKSTVSADADAKSMSFDILKLRHFLQCRCLQCTQVPVNFECHSQITTLQ